MHGNEIGTGSYLDGMTAPWRADERTFDIGQQVAYRPVSREELLTAAATIPQTRELAPEEMALKLGGGKTVAQRLADHPGAVARIRPARKLRRDTMAAQVFILLPKRQEGACEPLTLISEVRE